MITREAIAEMEALQQQGQRLYALLLRLRHYAPRPAPELDTMLRQRARKGRA